MWICSGGEMPSAKTSQDELGWRVQGLARRKSKEILARRPPVPNSASRREIYEIVVIDSVEHGVKCPSLVQNVAPIIHNTTTAAAKLEAAQRPSPYIRLIMDS